MEEKIGFYPELPPDERREVEEYVEGHPHLRESFEHVLRLDEALREGRALADDPPGDEALAFAAVMHDVDVERMPVSIRDSLRRVERYMQTDARARDRYEAFLRRREELENASDIEAQFRRLVGASRPSPAAMPKPRARHRRMGRLAAAAASLAAGYALLFLAGHLMRPEHERLARFDESELTLEGYDAVRSPDSQVELTDVTRSYLDALRHLREAEKSIMGLFPRYEQNRLDSAAAGLRRVRALEPPESFLADEAAYLLAKTELASGNESEARRLLEGVAASGGRHASAAERLLGRLGE